MKKKINYVGTIVTNRINQRCECVKQHENGKLDVMVLDGRHLYTNVPVLTFVNGRVNVTIINGVATDSLGGVVKSHPGCRIYQNIYLGSKNANFIICDRWRDSFEDFLSDLKEIPGYDEENLENLSLYIIYPHTEYSKTTCVLINVSDGCVRLPRRKTKDDVIRTSTNKKYFRFHYGMGNTKTKSFSMECSDDEILKEYTRLYLEVIIIPNVESGVLPKEALSIFKKANQLVD